MEPETVELKNHQKIILRPMNRLDLDMIWDNFNQVIDEGIYLPTFEKVTTEYEKTAWFQEMEDLNNICVVGLDPSKKPKFNVVAQCTIEDIQWEASDHVAVLGIIVRKGYRNTGLGYHLIKYALEASKHHGKEKVILSTFSTNPLAIHLYEKVGFEIVGTRKKHFKMHGQYIDEVLMDIWIGDSNPNK